MTRRRLLLVLVACSAVLAVSTAAFSSVEAGRQTTVDVAPSDAAYLAYDDDASVAFERPGGHEVDLFDLSNRFDEDLTTVSVSVDEATDSGDVPDVSIVDAPGSLDSGESDPVTAMVECGNGGGERSESVTLLVAASGPEREVDATATVSVTCDVPTQTPDESAGNSPPGQPENPDQTRCGTTGDDDSTVQAISHVTFCFDAGDPVKFADADGDGQFEAVDEDDFADGAGLTVTTVETKDGEPTEVLTLDWQSADRDVVAVVVKSGTSTCAGFPTDGTPPESGTVTACDYDD
jgi:hypothetical protein